MVQRISIYRYTKNRLYKLKMVDLNRRCPTGIPGLDELIGDGFPRKRSILLSGSCGTGKTIFGVQFLHNGITKYSEPGILVTLEQEPRELKQDMLNFDFDLQKLENEGKLVIIDTSLSRVGIGIISSASEAVASNLDIPIPKGSTSLFSDEFNIEKILDIVVQNARRIGAKRVVIDSLPALDFLIGSGGSELRNVVRQIVLAMNYRLKANGLTLLLITETRDTDKIFAHNIEGYVVDGVVVMYYAPLGTEAGRSLLVRKMRSTKHSEDIHPIVIEDKIGIRVLSSKETYKI